MTGIKHSAQGLLMVTFSPSMPLFTLLPLDETSSHFHYVPRLKRCPQTRLEIFYGGKMEGPCLGAGAYTSVSK